MGTSQWLEKLFETVDSKDADKLVSYLTDDATFRFANAQEVEGKQDILGMLQSFYSSIEALSHKIVESWQVENNVICRGEVTYTRKDKSELTVPFANFFAMDGSKIKSYLIYVDASQLFV
jgi:ketosteroid isomerase-like protein